MRYCNCSRGIVDNSGKCYLCRQEEAAAAAQFSDNPVTGESYRKERKRRMNALKNQMAEIQEEIDECTGN